MTDHKVAQLQRELSEEGARRFLAARMLHGRQLARLRSDLERKPVAFGVVCAWCKQTIRGPLTGVISHGICASCRELV